MAGSWWSPGVAEKMAGDTIYTGHRLLRGKNSWERERGGKGYLIKNPQDVGEKYNIRPQRPEGPSTKKGE